MTRSVREELELIRSRCLYRGTRLICGRQSARVVLDGQEVLMLCSNNYLGLADHPFLTQAAIAATERYGTSSGASRLVSGTMELHEQLEDMVSGFKRTSAALVFNSGFAANSGIIPALVGRGDIIFSDRLNHASIIDGAMLSGAKLVRYPHNDTQALAALMEKHRGTGRCLIVTDGVFSMDGDLAPLGELAELKSTHDAFLMVDDAHGAGVLGNGGRGAIEQFGILSGIDIQMGTLGKAFGSFGAYVAASEEIVDYLVNRARSFIFSTSLPPSVLAASLAAFDLVDSSEGALLRGKLATNVSFFRSALRSAGLDTMGSETQIVPVFVGEPERVMDFSQFLLEEGLFVQGIRPPTVPAGSCRLRCTIMATHDRRDLEQAIDAITRGAKKLGVI